MCISQYRKAHTDLHIASKVSLEIERAQSRESAANIGERM